jgi:hypothetical protein
LLFGKEMKKGRTNEKKGKEKQVVVRLPERKFLFVS